MHSTLLPCEPFLFFKKTNKTKAGNGEIGEFGSICGADSPIKRLA